MMNFLCRSRFSFKTYVQGHENLRVLFKSPCDLNNAGSHASTQCFAMETLLRQTDIKPCYTEKFLLQKLNYIHNNPVITKWKLAKYPEEYFHSSASFYILNKEHECIKLTHWKDVGERLAHRPHWRDDARQ